MDVDPYPWKEGMWVFPPLPPISQVEPWVLELQIAIDRYRSLLAQSDLDEDYRKVVSLCLEHVEKLKADLPVALLPPRWPWAITQKARGFITLEHSMPFPGAAKRSSGLSNVAPMMLPGQSRLKEKPLFLRPCPLRPRHGFVESRIVTTWAEVLTVMQEAYEQDEWAEFIFAPVHSGKTSAVATNAGVTWGFGNDGATSALGDKPTVFIPAATSPHRWNKTVLKTVVTDIKDTAYLEVVEHQMSKLPSMYRAGSQSIVVQLRDGPEQSAAVDYVPKDVKVQHVVMLDDEDENNLLVWERKIKRLASSYADEMASVVFYYPNGSLSSHYAVHAIEHGMTVLTSWNRPPYIGEHIAKVETTRPELTQKDYEALAALLKEFDAMNFIPASDYDVTTREAIILSAVGAFHAMSQWGASRPLMLLRASAFVAMGRFLSSAVLGELRHYNRSGPGTSWKPMRTKLGRIPSILSRSRRSIYETYLQPVPLDERIAAMKTASVDFRAEGWHSGYGGYRWADLTVKTRHFLQAMQAFIARPNARRFRSLMLKMNVAMHVAHNGGYALNKWISQGHMNHISTAPALGFLNQYAARVVLDDGEPFDDPDTSRQHYAETEGGDEGENERELARGERN